MHISTFVAGRTADRQFSKLEQDKTCGVCQKQGTCYSDVLLNTFTDLDKLSSKYICHECSCLFSGVLLKTAFYITSTEVKKLKQNEFEKLLFIDGLDYPCALSFSESRKKHRLYRTPVTLDSRNVYISTDDGYITLNIERDRGLFYYLNNLYNEKISKEWLRSGKFPPMAIERIGLDRYLDFQKITERLINTAKYNLIISFLNQYEKN